MNFDTYGVHVFLDGHGIKADLLDNINHLKQICKFAIAKSNATFVSAQEKKFDPQGCTLLFLLEESHMSIHTYPEHGYASIDMFTCGSHTRPDLAIDYLIECLKPDPDRTYRQTLIRGVE